MKKRIIGIICFIVIVALVVGIAVYIVYENNKVKPFSLNNNRYFLASINEFPSDKYLGAVLTPEEAKEHAVKEWVALFGEKIYKKKPFRVFFDEETNVWLVEGSLPRGHKGGVPYILIQKNDGKILAIWHDQ